MKVAAGTNAHGMEVFERLVIDTQGNLVRIPWQGDKPLKPGWRDASEEDVRAADKAQQERSERERQEVEKQHADLQARQSPPPGGPLLVKARENLDDPIVRATGNPDAAPVADNVVTPSSSTGPLAGGTQPPPVVPGPTDRHPGEKAKK